MMPALLLAAATRRPLWPETEVVVEIAARIGLTVLAGFVLLQLLFVVVGRIEHWIHRLGHDSDQARRRATTVGAILRNLCTVLVGAGVVVHALELMGWDVKPLLAGAGIIGVALGFGAQTLVRDVIAGIFIIAEDQYGVGDLIEVQGRIATVEELTVRSTTLRDFNGNLLFVPNGEMKLVVNRSRGWNRLAVDVPVATGADLDRALDICRAVAKRMNDEPSWRERLLDDIEVWGVEALGPAEAQIRLVVRARPGPDAPETARELRRRIHAALGQAGIRPSLPPPGGAVPPSPAPSPHATV